ncbi:MAG: class I SAM-dependent methyltransferase [Candidatus Omnitrophota bacterium]|nr:class I SAM-dependent methyltransferase [Candidatus Omnitrophota bacterium]
MNPYYYRRKTCRLCDSTQVTLGVEMVPTPPGDTYVPKERATITQQCFPLGLFFCQSCGCIQLLDVVDPAVIYAEYIYQTSISLGLPEHFLGYVDDIMAFVAPRPQALVIDIGSNDGTLLLGFKGRGMKVLGVDPSPAAVQTANQRGVETIQAFFSSQLAHQLKAKRQAAAIVTANNVMANIDEMHDFAEGIRTLIEPDGYFVFETGYGLDLLEKRLLDVVHHEHLSFFTVKSLEIFFRRHGMKIVDAQHIPTKGGSIRCIVQSQRFSRVPDPSVEVMIALEAHKKIDRIETFRQINTFISLRREEINKFLGDARLRKKSIAGYGASVGTTTLLYLFGLADKLDYFVDDNPIRDGLFSPGYHIPVYPSQELYEKKPDYTVIFAWRYIDPIMKRHEKFTGQGGRFITFLPEFKIF